MEQQRINELEKELEGSIHSWKRAKEFSHDLVTHMYGTQIGISGELLAEVKRLQAIVDDRADDIRVGNTVELTEAMDLRDLIDGDDFEWDIVGARGKVVEIDPDSAPDYKYLVVFDEDPSKEQWPVEWEIVRKVRVEK